MLYVNAFYLSAAGYGKRENARSGDIRTTGTLVRSDAADKRPAAIRGNRFAYG